MSSFTLRAFLAALVLAASTVAVAHAQDLARVQLTLRPQRLVQGELLVPVSASPDVQKISLYVNEVKHAEKYGQSVVFNVAVGKYLRRLRVRAEGENSDGKVIAFDEMVVNDPLPPFRLKLQAPETAPTEGIATMRAIVTHPQNLVVSAVEFFAGEHSLGRDASPPFEVSWDAGAVPPAGYVRAVALARGGLEAHDLHFWGEGAQMKLDVHLHQLPISLPGAKPRGVSISDVTLLEEGRQKKVENVIAASDQPLNVILLIDSSESMLEELPLVKKAAETFVTSVVRPNDRVAIVGFHNRTFWLTPFTSDRNLLVAAVDRLKPRGETHLYDATIEMIYELQRMPGRRALIVLTDGANQGGEFQLDHLIHYARYSGVPVYPVVKNTLLSRMMKFGIGHLQARRFADVARDTGATYFIVENARDLPRVYRTIGDELQKQWLVTFYSEPGAEDRWRPLQVKVDGEKVVRHPRGYFP